MLASIGRNIALLGSLVVGATISGAVAPLAMSPRGSIGPTVLGSSSLTKGLAAGAIAVVVATILGALVGRLINAVVGVFVVGGCLFGLAWRTEPVRELAFGGGPGMGLPLETALWSIVALGSVLVVYRVAGPLRDVEPPPSGPVDPLRSGMALKSAALGVLALPAVWLLARSLDKGQALGTVFCAAMVAGLAARLVCPHVQPILICASVILFGAVGQVVALTMLDGSLASALVLEEIPMLLRPMPVDWAAGGLMGVAVGIGWAKSFLHHEHHEREPEIRIRRASTESG